MSSPAAQGRRRRRRIARVITHEINSFMEDLDRAEYVKQFQDPETGFVSFIFRADQIKEVLQERLYKRLIVFEGRAA